MTNSNKVAQFYDKFGARLLRDFVNGNPRTENAILFACEKLIQFQRKNVLDLGFGLGWSTYEFSRAMPASKILGVDLSSDLKELASAMFGNDSGVHYECEDLCDSTWGEKLGSSYDACVMLDVYEHIPNAQRQGFHSALASRLSNDAIVILTCPTSLHQAYLRNEQPSGLQPVDEDVSFKDLIILAGDLGGEIVHFEYKSVWSDNDYFHVVISRQLLRKSPVTRVKEHHLMKKSERLSRLDFAQSFVGKEVIRMIKGEQSKLLHKIVHKIARILGRQNISQRKILTK